MKYFIILLFFTTDAFACAHLQFGTPLESDQIICRVGYAVGYNYSRKSADWVAYRLTPEIVNGTASRQDDFRADELIPLIYQAQVKHYVEPVYDMGHLVSSESQDLTIQMNSETFIMSNIAPQLPGLNRAVWKGLENRERKWTGIRGELFVYVGMLYEGDTQTYINDALPVPSHFFKIIYDPAAHDSIAYLFPHEAIYTSKLDNYLTTIDAIELRSGLNLLSGLNDETEEALENLQALKQW